MARPLTVYGIESRRMRIQLKTLQWKYLDDMVSREDRSISDVVERLIARQIGQLELNRRVSLTPLGEQAADDSHADAEVHNLGTGGAQW
jgi:predicted CopG family antitoxin